MSDQRCIWCLEQSEGNHEEHIIPEALGCPSGFVLPGSVVCRRCNNGLADLDQAVINEFDFLTFMAGVPRKKGKPPAIRSRGNVLGTVEKSLPTMTFNMEGASVKAHDGSRLAPYRGSQRDVRAKFSKHGESANLSFEIPFGQSQKFVRGTVKIGFSALAFFLGASLARSPVFAPIRHFVLNGTGSRHIMLTFDDDTTYTNRAWPPYVTPSGEYAVMFRIAFVEFLVDLSEQESFLREFQFQASKIFGNENWCTLPIRPC